VTRWLANALLAGALLAGQAAPAPAADGPTWHFASTPIDSFSYSVGGVTIKVPTGCFLTVAIKYWERNAGVETTRAGTDCYGLAAANPAWFCNRRMTFSFYDADGKRYHRYRSGVDNDCRSSTLYEIPGSVRGRFGKMCARFYTQGDRRAMTCTPIHR
jgi:hypothetical protein